MRIVVVLATAVLLAISAIGCGDGGFDCSDACKKIYSCGLTITVGGDPIPESECTRGCNENKAENPSGVEQALSCIENASCNLESMQPCLSYMQ